MGNEPLTAYKGLRDDVAPGNIVRERKQTQVEVDGRRLRLRLRLTNLPKVMYPDAGFTKADVLHYYARVAPTLLPHLQGRAMTLKLPRRRRRTAFLRQALPRRAAVGRDRADVE